MSEGIGGMAGRAPAGQVVESPPGKPRLRVSCDPATETAQSRQRGALQLGLACVALIRNPASHEDKELDEQVALEQLATVSLFARVVDECQVVTS
jgi:hypothetical protein